jgi:hypothetical protein
MDWAENTASNCSSVLYVSVVTIAWQQACRQSHSLTRAASAGFTVLASSRHATIFYTSSKVFSADQSEYDRLGIYNTWIYNQGMIFWDWKMRLQSQLSFWIPLKLIILWCSQY